MVARTEADCDFVRLGDTGQDELRAMLHPA